MIHTFVHIDKHSLMSGLLVLRHSAHSLLASSTSLPSESLLAVAMPIKSNNSFERSKHHQEHHCQSSSQKSVQGAEASKAASRPWES